MPLFQSLSIDLNDYALIVPSVSVGNVPQLTIDLLIKTYNFKKISSIWHPSIIPTVGADPYDLNCSEICTACDLYSNEQLKVACIQIRSTLDYKTAKKFFEDFCSSVKELNVKNVVILSSGFDYELHNIKKERFYILDNIKVTNSILNTPNVTLLEKDMNGKYIVNGAGFAIDMFLVMSRNLECILLGKYISEGDNRPDAQAVLEKLLYLLNLQKVSRDVEYPSSWAFIFGGPPPVGIY